MRVVALNRQHERRAGCFPARPAAPSRRGSPTARSGSSCARTALDDLHDLVLVDDERVPVGQDRLRRRNGSGVRQARLDVERASRRASPRFRRRSRRRCRRTDCAAGPRRMRTLAGVDPHVRIRIAAGVARRSRPGFDAREVVAEPPEPHFGLCAAAAHLVCARPGCTGRSWR